jgi:hypothetical protein
MSQDLFGPKILLIGPSGAGKTYALGTAVDWAAKNDVQVRALFIESGLETLLGYWRDRNLEVPKNLAWHSVTTKAVPLSSLIEAAKKVGLLSYEGLTKSIDPNRSENNPYEALLRALADFPDDRTGKKLGNIGEWKSDTILMMDSLSEIAWSAMKMVIGSKPTASPSDYGVAQNNLINFLRYLTQGFPPTVIMTAHIQRQTDEITGTTKLMTKAIGKAMADDIPQLFSETIGAVRDGGSWWWDTQNPNLDTKTRYLPIAAKIKPDFGQILDKWKKRGAV